MKTRIDTNNIDRMRVSATERATSENDMKRTPNQENHAAAVPRVVAGCVVWALAASMAIAQPAPRAEPRVETHVETQSVAPSSADLAARYAVSAEPAHEVPVVEDAANYGIVSQPKAESARPAAPSGKGVRHNPANLRAWQGPSSVLEALEYAVALETRMASRQSPDAKRRARVATALDAALVEVVAADETVRAEMHAIERRLVEAGVDVVILDRLRDAEARYDEMIAPVLASVRSARAPLTAAKSVTGDDPAANESAPKGRVGIDRVDAASLASVRRTVRSLESVVDALRSAESVETILRADLLPYRSLRLVATPPVTSPTITPSYASLTDQPATAADIAGSPAAPLAREILEQAATLDHDYVRIYEFVRNEIETELYAGSMRGAVGTLRARRGNDVDQASLLIALLRASQAPARYVEGVVELSLAQAGAGLGLGLGLEGDDARPVLDAYQAAGIAFEPVIQGGAVRALRVAHTWVSAQVPYTNYRGAVVDLSGRTWIPLAPALARYTGRLPTGVLRQMDFDARSFIDDQLAGANQSDPLTRLRGEVDSFLGDAALYSAQLGDRGVAPEVLGLLPSSMPATVVAVTAERPALGEATTHTATIRVRAGTESNGEVLLAVTKPHRDVADGRVTLAYQPATVEDQRTVNLFGGLGRVPAYLVSLRPVLRIGGRIEAVGEPIAMTASTRVEVTLAGPASEVRAHRLDVAGNVLAFGFGAPQVAARPIVEDDPADTEGRGPRLLSQIALGYSAGFDTVEAELADLYDVAVVRPLPSVAVAANAVDVEQLGDLPVALRWRGVTLDAMLRVAEGIDRRDADAGSANAGAAADWLRLAGLAGSALEHQIFETEFQVESISADRALGLARDQGIDVLTFDGADIDTALADLDLSPAVEATLAAQASSGRRFDVVRQPVTLNAWEGVAWRVEALADGAGGYFLAGGLAGGATTQPPGTWLLEFLEDALAGPYLSEANTDALAADRIVLFAEGDEQVGEVGQELPLPLTVAVTDEGGAPVEGALVTFSFMNSAGTLIGNAVDPNTGVVSLTESGGALSVLTDALGLASVRLRLDTSTFVNEIRRKLDPTDAFETQLSQHVIDAQVEGRNGTRSLARPALAYGRPGPAVRLAIVTGRDALGEANSLTRFATRQSVWQFDLRGLALDAFDNPVSNETIAFRFGGTEPSPFADGCTCSLMETQLFSLEPVALFDHETCNVANPTRDECGDDEVTFETSWYGARVGVISPGCPENTSFVDVVSPGLDPARAEIVLLPPPGCFPVTSDPFLEGATYAPDGSVISAAGTGMPYEPVLRLTNRGWFAPPGTWVPAAYDAESGIATGEEQLYLGNGGSTTPFVAESPDRLAYLATASVGLAPGVGQLTSGPATQPSFSRYFGIATVVPTIGLIDPPLLPIDGDGRLAAAVDVTVDVAPNDYRAWTRELFLYEDGALRDVFSIRSREDTAIVSIVRGLPFDAALSYTLEVVINRGTLSEVRSTQVPLSIGQQIIRSHDSALRVSQEIDLQNATSCSIPDVYNFELTRAASVNLELTRIDSIDENGESVLGSTLRLVESQTFDAGAQTVDVLAADVPPGDYRLVLTASDGDQIDTRTGRAVSAFTSRDALPVGQALVRDVNPYSGNLVLQRADLRVPGRGPSLAFSRTYSAQSGAEPGVLGLGWSHSYQSRIVVTPCNEVIVIGGEGSGMRFMPDGEGAFRPLRGYHGTLEASTTDQSFTFFTTGGTRYHYVFDIGRTWVLAHIDDPNGNRTTLTYEPSNGQKLLKAVSDASGRKLTFDYVFRRFALWEGDVMTTATGPDRMAVRFTYDPNGNLIDARREDDARIETYTYESVFDPLRPGRFALSQTTNARIGAVTDYAYTTGDIGFDGGLYLGTSVSSITLPEGGTVAFDYDEDALATRIGIAETRITDARGMVSTYSFDRFGSPVGIVDPLENETTMTWALDDVVLERRVDANGVETTFEHDEHGNVLLETVDGLSTVTTYWPPETFAVPIKNRVRSRTDRTGTTTDFAYDDRGNLVRETVVVILPDGSGSETIETLSTYAANGDRVRIQDPRGFATTLRYDVHGNLEEIENPLGELSRTEWSIRGLPIAQIDPLGRRTALEYDTLDRLTRRLLPDGNEETFAYRETWVPALDFFINERDETDAAGRTTTTIFDRRGRVTQIANAADGFKDFEYDAEDNKTLESLWFDTSTPREVMRFIYDDAGRLASRTEPLDRVTTFTHDGVGNVIQETLEGVAGFDARVVDTDYDALNRPIAIRRNLGGGFVETTMDYDGEGRKIFETDALGRTTFMDYDEIGRLVRVRAPESKTTTQIYDASSNLVETVLTHPVADQIRQFAYDAANRLITRTDATDAQTRLDYDDAGNVVRETDGRGIAVEHEYDVRDRRIASTLATAAHGPVVRRFDYDAVGNLVEETWPNGNVVTSTYDALNRLTETTDTLGAVTSFGYDARSNRIEETDAEGRVTSKTYDDLDRLIQVDAPEDRTVTLAYDPAGNVTSTTDARGNETRFAYDALDRRTMVTDAAPFSYVAETRYDAVGNVIEETDRRGAVTMLTYDDLNRLVTKEDPPIGGETFVTAFEYDPADNLIREVDRRGIETTYGYDGENRRTRVTRDGIRIASTAYDANGNVASQRDANGNETTFIYDERDLAIIEQRPLESTMTFVYDVMGDLTSATDAEGRVVTAAFDDRRRRVSETRNAGTETTTFGYDGVGNRTSLMRPNGNDWSFEYDDANRLTAVVNGAGDRTEYVYDAGDNLTEVLDGNGRRTALAYDELERLASKTLPDLAEEQYAYDENSNLIGRVDAKDQPFSFAFDAQNRQTLRNFPGDPNTTDDLSEIALGYDANNNLVSLVEQYALSGPQTTARAYDSFDRLERTTDRFGNTLTYGYDPNGNRTRLVDPNGITTQYAYDSLSRLATVTVPTSGTTTYGYRKNGFLDTVSYPNGTSASYAYDDANRVTSIVNRHDQATVSAYAYTYDANGNRVEQVEDQFGLASETTTYAYDDADRLLSAAYADKTVDYTYDAVGNRVGETESAPDASVLADRTYTYDDLDRLQMVEDLLSPPDTAVYGYDANGNQISRQIGAGPETDYVFDTRDQIIRVENDGSPVGSYQYDAFGLRVSKVTAAGTTEYTYDEQSVLLRRGPDGEQKYEYGPDRLLSVNDSNLGRAYYLFDGLGSVANLTTPEGTMLAQYRWDAWGNVREQTDTAANPFGFTGHEMDEESGLIYAKARFYDPATARFLSNDPVQGDPSNPPSLHRYLYAFQNPTVFVDPDGRMSEAVNDDKPGIFDRVRGVFDAFGAERNDQTIRDVEREFGGVAGAITGAFLGVASAVSEVGQVAIGAVETVGQVAVAGIAPNSDRGQEAALALEAKLDTTKATIKTIYENPRAVGAVVVDAIADAAVGIAQGDGVAISRLTGLVASVASGGAGVAGRAASAGSKVGAVARTAASATGAATRRAAGAAQAAARRITAIGRANRAAQTGRATPGRPALATSGRTARTIECFVAGTLVATAVGLVPIEAIEVGDEVWARDEVTGETRLQPVAQTFETPGKQIWYVEVEHEDGTVETLGTTEEHPFMVDELGWVPASRLQIGDRLVSNTGGWLRVRQVRGSPEQATVYNFEVAIDHTYFVGETGVWVHNDCDRQPTQLELPFRSLERSRKIRDTLAAGDLPSFSKRKFDRGGGNIAFSDGVIDGSDVSEVAFSGPQNLEGFVRFVAPEERLLDTKVIGGFDRAVDSEGKILEEIVRRTSAQSTGRLRLFTEAPPCESCSGNIQAFRRLRPGIELNLRSGIDPEFE